MDVAIGSVIWCRFGGKGRQLAVVVSFSPTRDQVVMVRKWQENSAQWTNERPLALALVLGVLTADELRAHLYVSPGSPRAARLSGLAVRLSGPIAWAMTRQARALGVVVVV